MTPEQRLRLYAPYDWFLSRLVEIRAWFHRCPDCHHRGYTSGFTGAPRWDQDPVVQACGWLKGRCGGCGRPA